MSNFRARVRLSVASGVGGVFLAAVALPVARGETLSLSVPALSNIFDAGHASVPTTLHGDGTLTPPLLRCPP